MSLHASWSSVHPQSERFILIGIPSGQLIRERVSAQLFSTHGFGSDHCGQQACYLQINACVLSHKGPNLPRILKRGR